MKMRNKKTKILATFMFLTKMIFCVNASANDFGTNQMLWIPSVAPSWNDFGNLTIFYPSLDAQAQITWPAYIGTGTVLNGVYSSCPGKNDLQSKTIIYGVPEKYGILSLTSNWKVLGKRGEYIYYGQTSYLNNESPECYDIGSSFGGVKFAGANFNIRASLAEQSLRPGTYDYSVPVKYGHFEYKSIHSEEIPSWVLDSLHASNNFISPKLKLNVTSNCVYPTLNEIILDHGVMNIVNADRQISTPANLSMACTIPTSVSFSLSNKDVPCGNGICEIRINKNKENITELVGPSGINLSITSTYRKGLNETGGKFTGNSVLKIIIN
ncbi:hypothetical protein KSU16_24630 [Escherichia coli]|uniref:hypothetical protein n=1 Tax=Escherichia coli TaxID=562 RepID=UPI0021D234F5|nr:hypothetical protein [Escherichia coli]MCU6345182.1 hypothetical protein [Escherichia coli]